MTEKRLTILIFTVPANFHFLGTLFIKWILIKHKIEYLNYFSNFFVIKSISIKLYDGKTSVGGKK